MERIRPLEPDAELFYHTLTRRTIPFSQVEPTFPAGSDLIEYLGCHRNGSKTSEMSRAIKETALFKIAREWRAWLEVHSEGKVDRFLLDNLLMRIMYPFVLKRDDNSCVLCDRSSDLTIHHIIRKRRDRPKDYSPYGCSVPTNLVTLCRGCHALYDPMIL